MKEFLIVVLGMSFSLMLLASPSPSGPDATGTSKLHGVHVDGSRGVTKDMAPTGHPGEPTAGSVLRHVPN